MPFDILQSLGAQTTPGVLHQKLQNEIFRRAGDVIRNGRLILHDPSATKASPLEELLRHVLGDVRLGIAISIDGER